MYIKKNNIYKFKEQLSKINLSDIFNNIFVNNEINHIGNYGVEEYKKNLGVFPTNINYVDYFYNYDCCRDCPNKGGVCNCSLPNVGKIS